MKTDRERLDETLTFIRNLNLAPDMADHHVQAVHAFASAFIDQHYGRKQHWYQKNTAMHTFSQGLSIGKVRGEHADTRKAMRAVSLLKAAIAGVGGVQAALAPRAFAGPRELIDAMWKARVKAAQDANQEQPLRDFLAWFKANPVAVLGTNKIFIMQHPGKRGTGAHNVGYPHRNVQDFRFFYNKDNDRYDFLPPAMNSPGSISVPAVSVYADHWTKVPGRGLEVLPGPGTASFAAIEGTHMQGADIMLTTQFSGCSFCIKRYGDEAVAAHLSPALRGSGLPSMAAGKDLADQLLGRVNHVAAGDFGNGPGGNEGPFLVYGKERGNVDTAGGEDGYPDIKAMYLIGFRQGNDWTIYSQHRDDNQTILTPIAPYIRP